MKKILAAIGGTAVVGAIALAPLAGASGSGASFNQVFTQPTVPVMSTGVTATQAPDVVEVAATTLATPSASPQTKATP